MAHLTVRSTATVITVTMVMTFVVLSLIPVTASSETSSTPGGVLQHLVKGTYILYNYGRRSERDLPECSSETEACNIAHRRYWLIPITERLCRCKDRSECPQQFSNLQDPLSQHVSNRAQLKFCGSFITKLSECKEGQVALRMQYIKRKNEPPYLGTNHPETSDTHSTLLCRCPWPHSWSLTNTTTITEASNQHISLYTCHELPLCSIGHQCGYIREDTLETYYTCSCPQHSLCVFTAPQSTVTTSQLHYHGQAYVGRCTPLKKTLQPLKDE